MVLARNITANKIDELQIAQSEIKYRNLMNLASDIILLIDIQTGIFLHANQKALRILGRNLAEIQQLHFLQINPPELRAHYQQLFDKYMDCREPVKENIILLDKKGRRIIVDVNSNILEIEGKKILHLAFRDISDKVENQQKIQKLKDYYESILNNIPIDIAVFDEKNLYQFINPQAVRDDFLRKWMINKDVFAYYKYRQLPRVKGEGKLEKILEARHHKKTIKWEENFIDKDAKPLHILRGMTPIFDEKGEFVMNILTGENITYLKNAQEELKISNEKFKNLVETINDWVWELDENNIYTYSSPQVKFILGYEPLEILGKTPFDFMSEEELARMLPLSAQIIFDQKPFGLLENSMLHKDGGEIALETSAVPIFDKKGVFRGFRGVDRDITAKHKADKILNQMMRELEARNFELDSFVYKVSHDLRAPLTSIMGLLSIMQEEKDLTILKQYLELAENRAQKLDNFIKTILTYSRSLKEKVKIKRIFFKKIIQQCFEELKYMPNANQVKLKIRVEGKTVF